MGQEAGALDEEEAAAAGFLEELRRRRRDVEICLGHDFMCVAGHLAVREDHAAVLAHILTRGFTLSHLLDEHVALSIDFHCASSFIRHGFTRF
jgi:predicted component of type VI protein secretion system